VRFHAKAQKAQRRAFDFKNLVLFVFFVDDLSELSTAKGAPVCWRALLLW
jgi:hypothetical protein